MFSRILKSDRAAVSIFVTIILAFVGFGLIALVVDVGGMYVERKAMVTAADAGALAGANRLREIASENGNPLSGASVSDAMAEARKFAALNGADPAAIQVVIETRNVNLSNGKNDTRQVVDVSVKHNTPTFFGRFLGDTSVDVAAQAIATWGYYYRSYMGDFLPLFVFDDAYTMDQQIILHDIVDENTTTAYGYIDIGSGMADIKKAIAGGSVGGTYMENNMLDGKTGAGNALGGAVETRMINANKMATAEERRKAMIGLIPVIDKAAFEAWLADQGVGIDGKWPAKIKLPIKYFAYFEIEDVVVKAPLGSTYALDPGNDYRPDGMAKTYDALPSNKRNTDHIVGHFTGEKVFARSLIEIGDQNKPDEKAALWAKLIK